ncbi:MAG: DUF177 domain-containing protein [Rhodospirillales bacterium]
MSATGIPPELSRPIAIDGLRPGDTDMSVVAGADERAALARRFGLVAIDRLEATLRLTRMPRTGRFRLQGELLADVVQTCVVTLEPVPAHIEAPFEVVYERASVPGDAAEVVIASEDEPEPLFSDTLDVGEVLAEELALALDPYPRAPGAEAEWRGDASPAPVSPFDALAVLKRKN